jgi:hypothetical protein
MTTPTGTINASHVNIELGRAANAPFSMNDSAVRALAGKPSGPITFNDLRGKTYTVAPNGVLTGVSVAGYRVDNTASCAYYVNVDGNVYIYENGAQSLHETWRLAGANSQFEIYFNLRPDGTDTTPTGIFNQWLPMSANRFLELYNPNPDTQMNAHVQVTLRRQSDGAFFSQVEVYLQAANGLLI